LRIVCYSACSSFFEVLFPLSFSEVGKPISSFSEQSLLNLEKSEDVFVDLTVDHDELHHVCVWQGDEHDDEIGENPEVVERVIIECIFTNLGEMNQDNKNDDKICNDLKQLKSALTWSCFNSK